MLKIKFTWDPAKAEKNLLKYDVSFDEAATIFKDPHALYFDDVEHSQKEKREIASHQRLRRLAPVHLREVTVNLASAERAAIKE